VTSRAEALEILRTSRAKTDALIARLDESQIAQRAALGGGEWSVKDLIGHLAGWEYLALSWARDGTWPDDAGTFTTGDEFNAAGIERKRDWTLERIRADSERIRAELVEAIEKMDDERWHAEVEAFGGKRPLHEVIGQILAGDKHGLFAHDLAHLHDLEESVRAFRSS